MARVSVLSVAPAFELLAEQLRAIGQRAVMRQVFFRESEK